MLERRNRVILSWLEGTKSTEEARDELTIFDEMLENPEYELSDLPAPLQEIAEEMAGS